RGRLRLVFPVETMDRHLAFLGELHPDRMLDPAGRAPGREDVDKRRLALGQVRGGESLIPPFDWRQLEARHRLADQGRGDLARAQRQAGIERAGNEGEDQKRYENAQAHAYSAGAMAMPAPRRDGAPTRSR